MNIKEGDFPNIEWIEKAGQQKHEVKLISEITESLNSQSESEQRVDLDNKTNKN